MVKKRIVNDSLDTSFKLEPSTTSTTTQQTQQTTQTTSQQQTTSQINSPEPTLIVDSYEGKRND